MFEAYIFQEIEPHINGLDMLVPRMAPAVNVYVLSNKTIVYILGPDKDSLCTYTALTSLPIILNMLKRTVSVRRFFEYPQHILVDK